MAIECSRLSEGGSVEGLSALHCEKTQTFIHEIARRIEGRWLFKLNGQTEKVKGYHIYPKYSDNFLPYFFIATNK